MSEFQIQTEKITGQAGDKGASGVFSARVSFEDGTVGTFVSCILVKGSSDEDLSTYVKDIFDIADKKLEGAGSGSLKVLQEAGEASRSLVETHKLDASFAQVLFYKNASYFYRFGDKVKIFVYQGEQGQEITFGHGSGHLKNKQVFLIGTDKFLTSFDIESYLKEANINLEEVVDGLATEISAKDDQGEIGAALVLISEVQSDETTGEIKSGEEDGEHLKIESDIEVEEDAPIMDPTHELEPGDDEQVAVSNEEKDAGGETTVEPENIRQEHKSDLSKFKNPLFALLSGLGSEISKLRKGEIMAMFRLRRNIVALGVIILVVLGVSAFFTLKGGVDREKINEVNSYLETASSKYEEGAALISLNQTKARVILSEANDEVNKALEIDTTNSKALELSGKITSKLKETEVTASVDFSVVVTIDGDLVSLFRNDGNLVGVSGSSIHKVTVDGETVDKYDAPNGTLDASVYDNKVFIFDGVNINSVDLADGTSEEVIEGQEAQDIAVFLGNVYLLGADQIYKYVPTEDGYAQGGDYLNEKETFDSNSRLAIDGSIWVTNGSSLSEYLRGDKEDFSLTGLVDSVGNLGEIYTDSNTSNVYVIDIENSALLVFDKDGLYKQAYQSSEFSNAKGLVVDEESGKLYIAVGSEILGADL